MKRIYRYEVPVDDQWHAVTGCSAPLHVGCRSRDTIEFWAWHETAFPQEFRVVGTGHPVTEAAEHIGTAIVPEGDLVWHLVRRT